MNYLNNNNYINRDSPSDNKEKTDLIFENQNNTNNFYNKNQFNSKLIDVLFITTGGIQIWMKISLDLKIGELIEKFMRRVNIDITYLNKYVLFSMQEI